MTEGDKLESKVDTRITGKTEYLQPTEHSFCSDPNWGRGKSVRLHEGPG